MYKSLIVIDDFYPNPNEVRAIALAADYPQVAGPRTFPGRNSAQKLVPTGLNELISRIVGERVVNSSHPGSSHGHFRITLAGELGNYLVHVDSRALTWVGVVYLNTPEQCRGGTSFFRHLGLNSDRMPMSEAELAACGIGGVAELLRRDGDDLSKWEHLMTVPMRFNRLIMYRPWIWHSAGEPFGDSLETGRLIQLVDFRSAPTA